MPAAVPVTEKTSSSKRSKSAGARVNTDSKSRVESETIVYKEGVTVCFVNGGDKTDETVWEKFCLGVVSILVSLFLPVSLVGASLGTGGLKTVLWC